MPKKYSDRRYHLLKARGVAKDTLYHIDKLLELLDQEEEVEVPEHNGIMNHVTPYTAPGGHSECPRCVWDSRSEDRRRELLNIK